MKDFQYEETRFKAVDARRRKKLNGWRRLWLVLTGLPLTGGVIFFAPIGLKTNDSSGSWDYYRSLETSITPPGCASFLTAPFNEMVAWIRIGFRQS